MRYLACLLLGFAAAAAADPGQAPAPVASAPAAAAPALSDDQTLAQQLVYCAIVAQKMGGKAQKAGWSLSYSSAAVALTSTAFVATQMLAQTGSADGLSQADLDNASAQCQQTMLANSTRIGAAMQGGAAKQ